jgi:hypothetical protein
MLRNMNTPHNIRLALFLLASLGDLPGDIHARELDDDWLIEVPLAVKLGSMFMTDGSDRTNVQSLSAGTGIELSPFHERWSVGLFVERHLGEDSGYDGLTYAGAYATWRRGAWSTSSAMMYGKMPGMAGAWHSATKLKRRLTDNHHISLLSGVPLPDPGQATIALGWEASIRRGLSLDLSAGAEIGDLQRKVLGIAVTWQIY